MFKLTKKAQGILDSNLLVHQLVDRGTELGEFIDEIACTDGFWYGLSEGYVDPRKILADTKEIEEITKAFNLLKEFEELWNSLTGYY